MMRNSSGRTHPMPVQRVAASKIYLGIDEIQVVVPETVQEAGNWEIHLLAEGIASKLRDGGSDAL